MINVKIYYEDTDLGGVVYYANYLKYFERARTEALQNKGVNLAKYHEKGVIFAVRTVHAEYLKPARYGDVLTVTADIERLTKVAIEFSHIITKKDDQGDKSLLIKGSAKLVCVGADLKIRKIPDEIFLALKVDLT